MNAALNFHCRKLRAFFFLDVLCLPYCSLMLNFNQLSINVIDKSYMYYDD